MQFDIIVVGSGPGGYVAAIRAAQLGFKTAIVERESLGGICLNWGCIPTKALLKSAQVFEYINHAAEYGITVGEAKADFGAIIKRSRSVATKMSGGIQFLMKKNKIEVVMGNAVLQRDNKVEVTAADGTKKIIGAPHIIIATGARPKQLPTVPIDGERVIEYRKAMTLDTQPKAIVVMGAGAIGIEFAYFYNSLGTKVTVVEYLDAILPREDADVSREAEKALIKQGISIKTGHSVERVEHTKEGCRVHLKNKGNGSEQVIECDVVLSATGITPNTENIGLEALGIKTERGFILVDNYYQTSAKGIYAIGDVIPTASLAHVASAEGILCVERIKGMHVEPINYNNIPSCTYCSPEVASVGYTEAEAKAAGYKIKVGKFPFSASGKASAAGTNTGFVKVIFDDKYGEFLGAHFVGANVTEMIAEVVVARRLETTGHEIIKSIHPHPTMSEAIMEAAAAAYGEVIHM